MSTATTPADRTRRLPALTSDDEQRKTAEEVIKTVDASGQWGAKVVTEVVPFKEFSVPRNTTRTT